MVLQIVHWCSWTHQTNTNSGYWDRDGRVCICLGRTLPRGKSMSHRKYNKKVILGFTLWNIICPTGNSFRPCPGIHQVYFKIIYQTFWCKSQDVQFNLSTICVELTLTQVLPSRKGDSELFQRGILSGKLRGYEFHWGQLHGFHKLRLCTSWNARGKISS